MKKFKISTLLFALVIAFNICTVNAAFPDVGKNTSYEKAVSKLNEMGIITGDENGNFNPNKSITRAEFATIICRFQNLTDIVNIYELMDKYSEFEDVPKTHWANRYILVAQENGIINGYGNNRFGPSDKVTVEQSLKMIVCALGYEDLAIEKGGYPDGYLTVAKELGIDKKCSFSVKTAFVNRWQISQAIYNSLDIQKDNAEKEEDNQFWHEEWDDFEEYDWSKQWDDSDWD